MAPVSRGTAPSARRKRRKENLTKSTFARLKKARAKHSTANKPRAKPINPLTKNIGQTAKAVVQGGTELRNQLPDTTPQSELDLALSLPVGAVGKAGKTVSRGSNFLGSQFDDAAKVFRQTGFGRNIDEAARDVGIIKNTDTNFPRPYESSFREGVENAASRFGIQTLSPKKIADGIKVGFKGGGFIGRALTKARTKRQNAAIDRITSARNIDEDALRKAINRRALNQDIDSFLTTKIAGIKPKTWLAMGVTGTGIGASLLSVDTMLTWYALDNAIGGQKFYVQDLRNLVQFGQMDAQTALDRIEKTQAARQIAIAKIESSAQWNPLLWPSKQLILTNAELDSQIIDDNITMIQDMLAQQEADEEAGTSVGDSYPSPQEWLDAKNEAVDYFNQEMLAAEEELRIANEEQRDEDAAFWLDYRKQIIELERQAREEAAEAFKANQEENTRSNLNFGIL